MRFLRDRFKELTPYHSDFLTEGVILNSNESPYAPPAELTEYLAEEVKKLHLNRYPDTDSTKLAESIAKAYGVKLENVICGVGSDELIDVLLASTINEDDKVLMPYPSFSMYGQYTLLNSGYALKCNLNSEFGYDVEKYKELVKEYAPKIAFICNPNNPTGCVMQKSDIEDIVAISKGIVIVDEAYMDFATNEAELSVIDLINKYDNLVVLRTFSKAYALAGSRVGYAIAGKEIIDLISSVKSPYDLNMFSQLAATWNMEHKELFKENARRIISERAALNDGLVKLGFKTYPSEANFIWLEMDDKYFDLLKERKIYIRRMSVYDKFYYRITVGTPEENAALLSALEELK